MAEINHIVEWQKGISPDRSNDDSPLIANLYKACSGLYLDILEALARDASFSQSILLDLRRSHSYLMLWADGYSVSTGMLDASLDKSKRAKRSTIRLLFSICHTTTKRLLKILSQYDQAKLDGQAATVTQAAEKLNYLAKRDDAADSDSDTSSDTSSDSGVSELDEIADDLRTDTECLLELGSRFNENTVGPVIAEKAVDPTLLSAWDPSNNFVDRIHRRYPRCEAKLAERLGKTNWNRVVRCHEMKIAVDQHQSVLEAETKVGKPTASIGGSRGGVSTAFQDSALGSSIPSAPSILAAPSVASPASMYAETVVSYRGGQGEAVRVPSLPQGPLASLPFPCVGCGADVVMTSKSAWKKHLFSDLQPYVCVLGGCNYENEPFSTKNEWENHVAAEHGLLDTSEEFSCPICQDKSLTNPIKFRTHLARHLEEIALTILPTNPDSEDGTDVDSGLVSTDSSLQSFSENGEMVKEDMKEDSTLFADLRQRIRSFIILPLVDDTKLSAFTISIAEAGGRLLGCVYLRDIEMQLMSMAQASAPTSEDFQRFGLTVLELIRENLTRFEASYRVPVGRMPYDDKYFVEAERAVRRVVRKMTGSKKQWPPLTSDSFFESNYEEFTSPPRETQDLPALPSIQSLIRDTGPRETPDTPVHPLIESFIGGTMGSEFRRLDPYQHEYGHGSGSRLSNSDASSNDEVDKIKLNKQTTTFPMNNSKSSDVGIDSSVKCSFPDCNKQFKRPCELRKHEKRHDRPWKCPIITCKYFEHGLPFKRDLDRHIWAKHQRGGVPAYECPFSPCPHKFYRKDNYERHMRKAHGWRSNSRLRPNDKGSVGQGTKQADLGLAAYYGSATHDTTTAEPSTMNASDRDLSREAVNIILWVIIQPLRDKPKFKEFEYILDEISDRIWSREHIDCLRDVEQMLILNQSGQAKSPELYYEFCVDAVDYVERAVHAIGLSEQTRPYNRPYSEAHFEEIRERLYSRFCESQKDPDEERFRAADLTDNRQGDVDEPSEEPVDVKQGRSRRKAQVRPQLAAADLEFPSISSIR